MRSCTPRRGWTWNYSRCSWGESLPLARRFARSAYDAAYLALADRQGESLITADERLYNAVHPKLKWVLWLGDYTE